MEVPGGGRLLMGEVPLYFLALLVPPRASPPPTAGCTLGGSTYLQPESFVHFFSRKQEDALSVAGSYSDTDSCFSLEKPTLEPKSLSPESWTLNPTP